MTLERIAARGLLLIPDAHIAGTPVHQRLDGYREHIMGKIQACLQRAKELELTPVFLGDLFHWPRENPNSLLVELMELFRPQRPFALVGNHDKHQARFTSDTSLAVLAEAGVVRLLDQAGPAFVLEPIGGVTGPVLIGASPDGTDLPQAFDPTGYAEVVWLTHHNINFPDFMDKAIRRKELPGVDWVINGHIHRAQPTMRHGCTRWANPGNITRLTFNAKTRERIPAASIWRPGMGPQEDLERWVVPHLGFYEVFPDQEFPQAADESEGDSGFLQGLERLAWRRTREGIGLEQFLRVNLNAEQPEAKLILELYEEVTRERDA